MTYDDYIEWANKYNTQAAVIGEKIEKRRRLKRFPSAKEREKNERAITMLYEMRRDCLRTYALLSERAEIIRRSEEHEKHRSDKRSA